MSKTMRCTMGKEAEHKKLTSDLKRMLEECHEKCSGWSEACKGDCSQDRDMAKIGEKLATFGQYVEAGEGTKQQCRCGGYFGRAYMRYGECSYCRADRANGAKPTGTFRT